MTLLAVERIKLLSTRSPWWTSALAVALVAGMTAVVAGTWPAGEPFPFAATGFFATFGMVVVMVMAAVAVTSEYRFSTIRTTFLAVPRRVPALAAKAAVVAALAAAVGLVAGFAAWGVANLLQPGADLALDGAAQWRAVAGVAPAFAVAAVLALAVGTLVRQTAGAVSLLLVWALLVENLVTLVPRVGDDIRVWLPFTHLNHFLTAGVGAPGADGPPVVTGMPFGPWGSLAYVAAVALGLLAVGLAVAHRRDA